MLLRALSTPGVMESDEPTYRHSRSLSHTYSCSAASAAASPPGRVNPAAPESTAAVRLESSACNVGRPQAPLASMDASRSMGTSSASHGGSGRAGRNRAGPLPRATASKNGLYRSGVARPPRIEEGRSAWCVSVQPQYSLS